MSRSIRQRAERRACAIAVAASLSTLWAPTVSAAPGPSTTNELLLDITLNGQRQPDALRVLMVADRPALAAADWTALHLKTPATAGSLHDGVPYHAIDALPGVRWIIEAASQTLLIDAPASAFAGTSVDLAASTAAASPVERWGGFGNYDLAWQRSSNPSANGRQDALQALLEAGTFGPFGTGRVSGLVRDDGTPPHWVRLDTTWTIDRPERMDSVRVGDAIGKAGAWGRALRFGGVQWATDFSTQPGFLSFPLPGMRGEAALPSTLDIYVNNSKRATSQVPAGPFELNDLPIVTGSGQVRVVVRDLLGREQVIVQSYAMSPSLLRPGLHAFSYELGAVREDYGLASDRYGRVMAAATDRLGISDSFTRELRAEWLERQGALGATGVWQLGSLGVASLSGVASHAPSGNGALLAMTAEHQDSRWSGSLQLRRATRDFAQVGQGAQATPRWQGSMAVGTLIGEVAIGASLVRQQGWDGVNQRLLTLTLTRAVGSVGTVSLFALRDLVTGSATLAVSFNMALGERTSVNLSATGNRNVDGDAARRSTVGTVQLQQNLPENEGVGYTLDATRNHDDVDSQRLTAQGVWQARYATVSAGLSQSRYRVGDGSATTTTTDARAGVSGGVAWLADSLFPSRRIEGSFAVVDVGGYPDVQVLHDHHVVARTDANGRALVAGLRGFETNRIGLDAADLPFDAEVDALEVELTPASRSGVVLRMPVRRQRAANLRLVDAEGRVLPAGSEVEILGRAQRFAVGLDGRSFVSGLGARTAIRARGLGAECRATLALDDALLATTDDVLELGTVSCR